MHPRAWSIAVALAALACQRANLAHMIGGATDAAPDTVPDTARTDRADDLNASAEVAMPGDAAVPDVSPPPPDVSSPPADLAGPAPAVVVSGSNAQDRHGATSGGTVFTDTCPGSKVVVSFRGVEELATGGIGIQRLAVVCGVMSAVVGSADYPVELQPGSALSQRGTGSGMTFDMLCPANEVVVRISGHAGGARDGLRAHCGRLVVGPDRQTPMVLAGTSLAAHGRTDGAAFDNPCPAGQVARGGIIRAGAWIDGFTLICGTPAGVP